MRIESKLRICANCYLETQGAFFTGFQLQVSVSYPIEMTKICPDFRFGGGIRDESFSRSCRQSTSVLLVWLIALRVSVEATMHESRANESLNWIINQVSQSHAGESTT